MLSGVAHDGDEDEPDKVLADVSRFDDVIDTPDEVVGAQGDDDSRGDEDDGGGHGTDAGLLGGLRLGLDFDAVLADDGAGGLAVEEIMVTAVEEVVVGTDLEEEVEDVEDQEDDGRAAGEEEDRVGRVGLDSLLLAVEDVVELRWGSVALEREGHDNMEVMAG